MADVSIGFGLTITTKDESGPIHPKRDVAKTVTVVIMGVLPILITGELGIFPLPEVPKPISFVLVHLNVEPDTELENGAILILAPAHKERFGKLSCIIGFGLTITVALPAKLTKQPLASLTDVR